MAEQVNDADPDAAGSEDSDDGERDGRFYGPDGSWKFYTKAERELAASLDQIEHDNLSAHLYNAHRLKRRLCNPANALPWQSRQRWIDCEGSSSRPFYPDANWTAWPLESADVPRNGEAWGVPMPEDDPATYRYEESWTPGSHLRDCVQAEIQRQAKERLRLRTFVGEDVERQATGESSPQTLSMNSDTSRAEDSSSSAEEAEEEAEESSDDPGEEHSDPDDAKSAARAIPLLDDEVVANLTRSTVGHIMSQFDAVLRGLHQSRMGHAKERSRSRHNSSTNMQRKSSGRSSQDLATRPQMVSQTRDSSSGSSPELVTHEGSMRQHRDRQNLGTRDWSEVLGIAALVGMDPSVVARTRHRCAALFDENMDFRVMPDAAPSCAFEEAARRLAMSTEAAGSEKVAKLSVSDGYPCLHTSCSRHLEPYPQLWRLREHLKRKHKHEVDNINAMVGDMKRSIIPTVDSQQLESGDAGERGRRVNEIPVPNTIAGHDEYLQPILIPIGRSSDRKARRTPSRDHLKRANVTQDQGIVVDEEAS
ncbi:hypothetical protein CERZMDRAFT_101045 [Cercospora zeae-maydis SCOH1-5]|uniref:Rrn9 domain-containing protein n=1 Tax=Cercospora zeae-maydis SCOH1-5 TaxID=717836 RepID=A0A6A6F4K4_9PEZI|nr:hypothetical protein CERZMDRAFT_101045 [Cercospora zeae-maydis SCOH1-5]